MHHIAHEIVWAYTIFDHLCLYFNCPECPAFSHPSFYPVTHSKNCKKNINKLKLKSNQNVKKIKATKLEIAYCRRIKKNTHCHRESWRMSRWGTQVSQELLNWAFQCFHTHSCYCWLCCNWTAVGCCWERILVVIHCLYYDCSLLWETATQQTKDNVTIIYNRHFCFLPCESTSNATQIYWSHMLYFTMPLTALSTVAV